MTPEEQRITIAEACGYDGIFMDDDRNPCGHKPAPKRSTEWTQNEVIPDYLNDLNAIRNAWRTLTMSEKERFAIELKEICYARSIGIEYVSDEDLIYDRYGLTLNAPAHYRAAAFLITKGYKIYE
jgi:hypothetical protein